MRLAYQESPSLQPAQYTDTAIDTPQNLLTPARRAALDALEREFHELLVRGILKAAAG